MHSAYNTTPLRPPVAHYPESEPYIQAALSIDRANLLTIEAFITASGFPLDTSNIGRFWVALHHNLPIYVDDAMICWLGFTPAKKENRKKQLLKVLAARHKPNADWFDLQNKEYAEFRTGLLVIGETINTAETKVFTNGAWIDFSSIFPSPASGLGARNTKHLLFAPISLDSIMSDTCTETADSVRQNYDRLRLVIDLYKQYRQRFMAPLVPASRPQPPEFVHIRAEQPASFAAVPAPVVPTDQALRAAVPESKEGSVPCTASDRKCEVSKGEMAPTDRMYVATSPKLASNNNYIVGGAKSAEDLAAWLAEYNAPRTEPFQCHVVFIAECYDFRAVEALLWTAYGRFRAPDTGFAHLHIDDLLVGIRGAIIAQKAVIEPIMHNYEPIYRRSFDPPRDLPPVDLKQDGSVKYKKRAIPKAVRNAVWDRWIGKDRGIGACFICGGHLDSKHFECGHVEAERSGGAHTVDNLRPVCSLCNKSVGQKNMATFKKAYF